LEENGLIRLYAKDEWKDDVENIVIISLTKGEEVADKLKDLHVKGYDATKIVIVFPENFSIEQLEAGEDEPEDVEWYILYHKTKSKYLTNLNLWEE
jgi:hypothetical protein